MDKRINLNIDGDLRERHKRACLSKGVAQSERLIQAVKADVKAFETAGELPDLDYVSEIADLIPRRFGVLRSIEKATGIDAHRLQAIGNGEIPASDLSHEELAELAAWFDMPLEELVDLVGSENDGTIQQARNRGANGSETLQGCNGG